MASKFLGSATKGVGRRSLDLPVAAFAALSVGFVAFAMPGDLLANLVETSGLPSLLPAAQPPLGNTARIAVALAGAIGAFALVYLLLKLIDRAPSRPRPVREETTEQKPERKRRLGRSEPPKEP